MALWCRPLPLKHHFGPHSVLVALGDLGSRVVDVVLEDEHVACLGLDADRGVGVDVDEGGVSAVKAFVEVQLERDERALLVLPSEASVKVEYEIVSWAVAKKPKPLV